MTQIHNNAALIIIDVQTGLDEYAYYGGNRNNLDAEAHMASLLQAWRETDRPVFHVKHNSTEPKSPLRSGQPGNAIKPEVAPQGNEPIIEKNVNSAFIGTDLEQRLRDAGISQLVIVGLTTNHCVSSTTRMAGNYGFETVLVGDATAAFDRDGFDGAHFSAQMIHDTTLATLNGEFATVLNTKDVLENL
ncbi:cysteine hydrolase [Phototrophicus methaneseepsis]|uniref:Cysteine hydrolase n=1 Tax=Phototrophicus methaneseepsis TaxID=2710758 RepID=A0A7S8EAX4_9CHLR|nr:cysteine hydrolase family protein [Phototrophicus methaneseepsis]QPC83453.1 cysteine hydrolase [Phototrophicus methaneseepsis]